jgi:DNA-binding XRE family transcriptional regulator
VRASRGFNESFMDSPVPPSRSFIGGSLGFREAKGHSGCGVAAEGLRKADPVTAMNILFNTDKVFPAWLTMSWAWEQSMDDPDEVKAVIARNLRRLREERGLTQQSLAKLSLASLAAVRQIESAKTLPDIALVWQLARALGVPCTAFLCPGCEAKNQSRDLPRPV